MQIGVYLVNKVKDESFYPLMLAENDYTKKGHISPKSTVTGNKIT